MYVPACSVIQCLCSNIGFHHKMPIRKKPSTPDTVIPTPKKKKSGGPVANAGKKKGTLFSVVRESRDEAKALGLLPHEWLLKVSRGDPIPQTYYVEKRDKNGNKILDENGNVTGEYLVMDTYADLDTRIDCAKAAAPYYAPKLAVQVLQTPGGPSGGESSAVVEALKQIADKLPV